MENRGKSGEASACLSEWFESKRFNDVRINVEKQDNITLSERYQVKEEVVFCALHEKSLSARVTITDDQKCGLGVWSGIQIIGSRYLWGFEPFSSDMNPIITSLDEVSNGNFFFVESAIFGERWCPFGNLAVNLSSYRRLFDSGALKSGLPLARTDKLRFVFNYHKTYPWT